LVALSSGDLVSFLRNRLLGDVPTEVALPVVPLDIERSTPSDVTSNPPPAAVDEQPRAATASPSAPDLAGSRAPAGPRLSAEEIAALVARGDAFLTAGDITSARLFFQRAADAGNGRAAMRMALTFDAAFLDRAGVHGARGDPEQAKFWYRRALELGEVNTERGMAPGNQPPAQRR
jgi:hypothetical protein